MTPSGKYLSPNSKTNNQLGVMKARQAAWLGSTALGLWIGSNVCALLPAVAQNQPLVMQGLPLNPPHIPSLATTPKGSDGWNYPTASPGSGSYLTPAVDAGAMTRYRVEVSGADPLLLATVQTVEPLAFVRTQEQVIQVGTFSTEGNARTRVAALQQRGVVARVVPLAMAASPVNNGDLGGSPAIAPATDMPPASPTTVDFSAPPPAAPMPMTNIPPAAPAAPAMMAQLKDYVVVIPAPKGSLNLLVQTLQQSGYTGNIQVQKDGRLGSYAAAGGFGQRSDAEYWNKQFRSMGFDARVVFFR